MTRSSDRSNRPEAGAIERLQKLGLTEYGARIYVALLRLGSASAREIADATSVPRTRVYDGVETLEQRGLVDIQYTSPKVFQPISRESAIRRFQLEYDDTLDELADLLTTLEPADRQHEQPGVWTVTGQETIDDRARELVGEAEEEIVCLYADGLLTDAVVEELTAAAERGVTIRIAGVSPAIRKRIRAAIPTAETYDVLWEWAETPAGRVFMIDRETILVSALTDGGSPEETAIWGSGQRNSLVVVLRAIFAWWLDGSHHYPDD